MAPSSSVKLRAHDPLDMEVIATWLQDALVPLADLAYLPREKRFVMVANRFMWESATPEPAREPGPSGDARFEDETGDPAFQRVNCGVCFDRVRAVRYRGLDPKNKDHILNLLTIEAEPRAVMLVFSGEASIRLEVTAIACHLEDLGEPWPTHWLPDHGESDAAEQEKAGGQG
jgi:hypothetical protein